MSEDREHAKLSPSSSSRWMHCAGSIELNRIGKGPSIHADQGTAAHNLLDMCLRLDVDPEKFLGKAFYKHHEVDDDMCEAVRTAMDYISDYTRRNPNTVVHLDKKVDPFIAIRVPKDYASGTLDVALDNAPEELVVIDYKHGAGVSVEAVDNTQLLQYTLGYFSQFATRPYKRYRLIIIQPRDKSRKDAIRPVVISHEKLLEYGLRLKKRIREIEKNPDQRTAGKWCKFCAGAGKCKTFAEYNMQTAALEFGSLKEPVNPKELDPEELDYALSRLPMLEKWIKAVMAEGLTFLMKGGKLENHKMVRGRQTRSWENEDKVKKILRVDFDEDEYAPRELLGVRKVEQLIKRKIASGDKTTRKERTEKFVKEWSRLEPLVHRSLPPIHIAHKSDERAAVKRGEEFLGKEIK